MSALVRCLNHSTALAFVLAAGFGLIILFSQKGKLLGASLVVQWLGLRAPKAWVLGSIPGWGARTQLLQLRPGAAK